MKKSAAGIFPYSGLLFTEKVTMRTGAGEGKHEHVIFYAVDQQPVGKDMTLPVAGPVSGQSMVTILFIQRLAQCELCDDCIKKYDL